MKRKILITILSTILVITTCLIITSTRNVRAEEYNTTMFMPASKLEFYDLNNPEAIFIDNDGNMVVSEYSKPSNQNTLIYFRSQDSQYLEITLSNEEGQINGQVSYVALYDNFILFLYSSRIYTLNIPTCSIDNVTNDNSNDVYFKEYLSVAVAQSFSVNNNMLIAQHSSGINLYEMSVNSNEIVFTKTSREVICNDILYCFLSKTNDIYYSIKGQGIYCSKADNVSTEICSTKEIAAYMAECGEYIYFTTEEALYRVMEIPNSTLEEVIFVTNEDSLGYLKSPRGLSVRNNKMLVVDNKLNCIQEIDPETKQFTSFAITTQSTANYRITDDASSLFLSENYLYVLDKNSTDVTDYKNRIVRISLKNDEVKYKKIDLSPIYEYSSYSNIKFAASDTHLLISFGTNLVLYKLIDGDEITLEKTTFAIKDINIENVFYLDNEFYYMNNEWNTTGSDKISYIYKIKFPTEDNGLTSITKTLNTTIEGECTKFTVDVFGNIYSILKKDELFYIKRNNDEKFLIDSSPINIQVDFKGQIYVLYQDDKINCYSSDGTKLFDTTLIHYSDISEVKDFCLNYTTNEAYLLSNSCILTTTNNSLNINTLDNISAENLKINEVLETLQFIKVGENAKLFKVDLNSLIEIDNIKYFNIKYIEPITNPNTKNIYIIIAELDSYYVISYSEKLTALIKKDSLGITEINEINYNNYSIYLTNEDDSTKKYVTNTVSLFSKPIFDENHYKQQTIEQNTEVYVINSISFNGKSMSLISLSSDGEAIGYIPTGYISSYLITENNQSETSTLIIDGEGNTKTKRVLLILIIAFTVTITMLLLENKILFKNPSVDDIDNSSYEN